VGAGSNLPCLIRVISYPSEVGEVKVNKGKALLYFAIGGEGKKTGLLPLFLRKSFS